MLSLFESITWRSSSDQVCRSSGQTNTLEPHTALHTHNLHRWRDIPVLQNVPHTGVTISRKCRPKAKNCRPQPFVLQVLATFHQNLRKRKCHFKLSNPSTEELSWKQTTILSGIGAYWRLKPKLHTEFTYWCLHNTYVSTRCFQKSTICAERIAMNCNYHHDVTTLWRHMETGVCRYQ